MFFYFTLTVIFCELLFSFPLCFPCAQVQLSKPCSTSLILYYSVMNKDSVRCIHPPLDEERVIGRDRIENKKCHERKKQIQLYKEKEGGEGVARKQKYIKIITLYIIDA